VPETGIPMLCHSETKACHVRGMLLLLPGVWGLGLARGVAGSPGGRARLPLIPRTRGGAMLRAA
jgi:hypothetical protein